MGFSYGKRGSKIHGLFDRVEAPKSEVSQDERLKRVQQNCIHDTSGYERRILTENGSNFARVAEEHSDNSYANAEHKIAIHQAMLQQAEQKDERKFGKSGP